MPSKIADINLSLHLTSRQLQVLTEALELEAQRTIDSEGFCGGSVDELENMELRCDLLSVLLQLAYQTLRRQGATDE